MVRAVENLDLLEVERTDVFQTCHVDAVLLWIGTTLVMGVDATLGAEEVLRSAGWRTQLVYASDVSKGGWCIWNISSKLMMKTALFEA